MAAPVSDPPPGRDEIARQIGRKAERKLKARGEQDRGVWFGLGMFGLIGWSIAIPTILGIALGAWMDARLQDRISWTLTLLFVGIVLGCVNAWYWMKRESRHD